MASEPLVFDQIEVLKKKWTDKYVVVDAAQAELRRFEGQTGLVKTVNMSGRALVQFDAHSNIGWFDIDLAYLKQIDAPLPKVVKEKPKAEAKPAAAAKPAGAAKPAAAPAGKSVADILAAARTAKADAPASKPAAAPAPAGKLSTADILAAARAKKGEAAPAAEAKPVPAAAPAGKMSTADILAAARGKKAEAPPAAEKPAAKSPPPAAKPEPVAEPEPKAAATPAASSSGSKKDAFKTVAQIVDYCRQTDKS